MALSIQCYQCGTRMTLKELVKNQDDCPECGAQQSINDVAKALDLSTRAQLPSQGGEAVEAQAREISSLRNIISECATACGAAVSVECSLEFMAMLPKEIALKARPSGVVLPDGWVQLTIEHEHGYPEDVAFGPQRMMDRLKKWLDRYFEMRLNSSTASAGDERTGWTEKKPTEEGAYWIRGNGLEADALVQVKQEEGELWCNLHMRNSEPDFDCGYTIEQLSSEFEWLGPLQVRAAPSAGSQKEQGE